MIVFKANFNNYSKSKYLRVVTFCLFFVFFSFVTFALDEYDREKIRLLIEKGRREVKAGKYEDAMASFEEAYQLNMKDSYPLLLKAELYCQFGIYNRAKRTLEDVQETTLATASKVMFHLLNSRIALASESLEVAARHLETALTIDPKNDLVKVRLAMVYECLGKEEKATELIGSISDYLNVDYHSHSLGFTLMMLRGWFRKSWQLASVLASRLCDVQFQYEETPAFLWFWRFSPIFFVGNLYLSFGSFSGIVYLLLIFTMLAVLANILTSRSYLTFDVFFVISACLLLELFWHVGMPAMKTAVLFDFFNYYAPVWIVPRLLCGIHLVTLALFVIFPLFQILPAKMRPRKSELYSIWFFCFWFMLFVLLFQSSLSLNVQLPFLLFSLAGVVVSALFMPLGRFVIFLAAQSVGIGVPVVISEVTDDEGFSFTDGKINEAKVQALIEKDEFDQAISIARDVFAHFNPKIFPSLWLNYVKAQIEKGDFFSAESNLKDYLNAFPESSARDLGLLMQAFLKSLQGDHAGALGIVKEFSDEKIRSFSKEHVAWSLYILARCNLHFNHQVQAHIDFTKALSYASIPLTKSRILFELVQMDVQMNRIEWGEKWLKEAKNIANPGLKTQSFIKLIESTVLSGKGCYDEALHLALEADEIFPNNTAAMYWGGRILCKLGRLQEAENILEKMPPDTEDARKLMLYITTPQSS